MEQKLKEKLKKIIFEFEGIRYIYITKKETFFIFKKAFRDHESVSESYSDDGSGRPVFDGWVGNASPFDDCVIFHKNKLIEGEKVKAYIPKYRTNINESPEFLIDTILEGKELKIHSPKYITPIKDLFRYVGLLAEKRGCAKIKSQEWRAKRNKAIVDSYNKICSGKTAKTNLPLKEIKEEVKKRFPKKHFDNADTLRIVEEIFDVSDRTIRGVLKPYIKK